MKFIDIPTERTTALTDLLMAILVAIVLAVLAGSLQPGPNEFKVMIWLAAFGFLFIASAFGAIAHGFKMTPRMNKMLWQPLNFSLGLVIGLFVVGVVFDLWGESAARELLPFMVVTGIAFYGLTVLVPGTFLVFIGYEAVAMLFSLGGYIYLAARTGLAGAWLMAAGVLVTILAAAIQATGRVKISVIWEFDHNGIFHIIQMPGVLLLLAGLLRSLSI